MLGAVRVRDAFMHFSELSGHRAPRRAGVVKLLVYYFIDSITHTIVYHKRTYDDDDECTLFFYVSNFSALDFIHKIFIV